jgi:phage/plasmid primase-like uncharacterized protein
MPVTTSPAAERIYLAVPYEARDRAKTLGARWDREAKAWYVQAGRDMELFTQWARSDSAPPLVADPRELFSDELRLAGFRLSGGHPVMDGKIHRIQVDGDKAGERNGSYRGFLDGVPNGWHQNFKTTEKPIAWKADASRPPNTADRAGFNATAATKRAEDAKQRDRTAELAAQRAVEILSAAAPAIGHAYLTAKQVRAEGLFIAAPGTTVETQGDPVRVIDIGGRLLVPVRDAKGVLTSLQIIDDPGTKMFLPGGKVGGGQHSIGRTDSPWPLYIAEGYATAATIHAATGHAVAVAFTAHNLGLVAAQHRAGRPDRSIFIAGDNDHHLPLQLDPQGQPKRNVGLEAANAAAAAVDGHALIPVFETGNTGTDWNDAMKQRSMAAIQAELAEGIARATRLKIANDMAREKQDRRTRERTFKRDIWRGRT